MSRGVKIVIVLRFVGPEHVAGPADLFRLFLDSEREVRFFSSACFLNCSKTELGGCNSYSFNVLE